MLALGVLFGCGAAPVERVLLISIDTLRADHVGCYGSERAHTPVLDGLAAAGLRFERALSPTPLTLPSHTTLLTGLDPPEHGVRHNSVFRLSEDVPTLAEGLAAQGFATAAFVGALVLDGRFGLDRGFQVYDDRMGVRRSSKVVGYAERTADQVVDASLAWLETAPERFLLWVHFYDPHADYDPPPGFSAAFASVPYHGEIAFVDSQLRRLIDAVDARYPASGTLVVATSDHGESLGEHGEPSHSYSIYDATQRVPLILRGGGLPAARTVSAPVRLADVTPTVLAMVGAAPFEHSSGRDLRETLEPDAQPRSAYLETLATRLDHGWSPLFGLHTERYKYIRAPRPELYDLDADPQELENLAAAAPAQVAALEKELAARLEGARPLAPSGELSEAERAGLRALGYVVPDAASLAETDEGGRLDPKDGMQLLQVLSDASNLADHGHPEQAVALLAQIESPSRLMRTVRASFAIQAGDGPAAERDARASLAESETADVVTILAGSLEIQGRAQEAAASYRRAIELDPSAAAARVGLGRLSERAGDREAAVGHYGEALAMEAPDPEARWRLAALHFEAGRVQQAEALVGDLRPGALSVEAVLRLAQAELAAGRRDSAGSRLAAAAHAPRDSASAGRLADLLEQAGRMPDALAVRERRLAEAPEDAARQNAVAWSLSQLGREPDRALALAAAAAKSGDPEALDTLAAVRLARGDWAEALAAADRALAATRLEPLRAHIHYLRAAALAGRGDAAAARQALSRALASAAPEPSPWHVAAQELAGELGLQPPQGD